MFWFDDIRIGIKLIRFSSIIIQTHTQDVLVRASMVLLIRVREVIKVSELNIIRVRRN
jgi:hypothetical protein